MGVSLKFKLSAGLTTPFREGVPVWNQLANCVVVTVQASPGLAALGSEGMVCAFDRTLSARRKLASKDVVDMGSFIGFGGAFYRYDSYAEHIRPACFACFVIIWTSIHQRFWCGVFIY